MTRAIIDIAAPRERFHSAGPDARSDYELLEMTLFPALPRRDIKPLAETLLKKFGSFAEVVHAPEARPRDGAHGFASSKR
jgi:DNA repair protein RadC